MTTAHTSSVEATRALAGAVADLLRPGDLLLLVGELGAGKTAFVQGLGAALGVDERITSPTFALHNRYEGRLRLEHLDAYRLERLEEVLDLDLPDLLEDGGVVAIEWGDTIAQALPADHLVVRLSAGAGDDERQVAFEAVGPAWAARRRALADAVAPWTEDDPC